jgi:hypothetical protein
VGQIGIAELIVIGAIMLVPLAVAAVVIVLVVSKSRRGDRPRP